MLDVEENPGIFTFLVGMIVLVLVAVGFSLLLDKRFKFSSGVNETRREMESELADLREVTLRHESRSAELARSGSNLRNSSKEHTEVVRKLDAMRQQEGLLREKKARLQSAVSALETDFTNYRTKYRAKTWARAVGENLGNLTLRGGREYRDSLITKVTDVGLEIRHEHGIARIQAPDLPPSMQDRFQWNDEERRKRLKEEAERLRDKLDPASAEQDPESPALLVEEQPEESLQPVAGNERNDRGAELEKIRSLRLQVRGWKTKVSRLRAEQSEATSNASYGNATSVPGSLETWKARSARLGRELSKARSELHLAKARLAAVSPSDPLLKPELQR